MSNLMRTNVRHALQAFLGALLLTGFSGAQAHHSFAMFDQKKDVMVSGTVTEFNYDNPHIHWRMQVLPNSGSGPASSYLLEGPTPLILKRLGWTRGSLAVGDKIRVKLYPWRDGTPGGQAVHVWLSNGKELSLVAEDVKYK